MTPSNNFSPLPWYRTIDEQNARRWWVYGREYPLYAPLEYLPPFQIGVKTADYSPVQKIELYTTDGTLTKTATAPFVFSLNTKVIGAETYIYHVPISGDPVFTYVSPGQYYCKITCQDNSVFWSDVFTWVEDITPFLLLEWWDEDDFIMDAGAIVYSGSYTNKLYLRAEIAKPEYVFEEEGESRDGYFFPTKQISEKKYKFNFLAPEYLLDVLRFARLADFVRITNGGQVYNADTFLFTPEWEAQGDLAAVAVEFETDTIAKKIGVGYIRQA